jgi:hypothetical protein
VRGEADHDVHVALADLATGETMVVEVVDPGCTGAAGSPHRDQMAQARTAFNVFSGNRPFAELRGAMVRVRGVGFFDFDHGQTGRSRSCFELHPVLDIQRVDF